MRYTNQELIKIAKEAVKLKYNDELEYNKRVHIVSNFYQLATPTAIDRKIVRLSKGDLS